MVPDGTRMKRSSKKFELHVAPHLRTSSATHVLQAHFHPPPRRDSPRLWRRLWALGRRSTNGPGPRHPGASKAVLWRCPEPWVHPGAMSGERGLMACHYQITIRLLSDYYQVGQSPIHCVFPIHFFPIHCAFHLSMILLTSKTFLDHVYPNV